MKNTHIWSNKGIAFYPPDFPIIGQNKIFNALNKYKQGFINSDIAGFFVLIGDWGLGKTRVGYELFAETTDTVDEWYLNKNDYILANTDNRILKTQLSEGILPLFIDYKSVIDEDLDAESWVPKVTCNALSLLWDRPSNLRVSPDLLDDMHSAVKAKGININSLEEIINNQDLDWKEKLDSCMEILKTRGINNLWVVVDEVETIGDLKKNPEYKVGSNLEVDETEINLISVVIKEARYREDHPYVNFLLLCSLGINEIINIGPNRRRCELIRLEPNQMSDIKNLHEYLLEINHDVEYPKGTLEGVFIATNRNFGWFNKVMSSIYTSLINKKQREGTNYKLPDAWELIEEYEKSESRSNEIFNTDILLQLKSKSITSQDNLLINKLVYGQLPLEVGTDLTKEEFERLVKYEIQGIGAVFSILSEVNIDASTLTEELVKPEYGFKHKEGAGDILYNAYTEFSVKGILSALKSFSISLSKENSFVIYQELNQFSEQLNTLYSYNTTDNRNLEQACETLHKIFVQYISKEKEYIATSFKFLKKINVRMNTEIKSSTFFKDSKLDLKFEEEILKITNKDKPNYICEGFAKILDDSKISIRKLNLNGVSGIAFESDFKSPNFKELSVTGNGRISIVYCKNVDETINELKKLVGKNAESVHPIVVLFGPNGDKTGFEKKIQKLSLLNNACITRNLTIFEEDFLTKYSKRDDSFNFDNELSPQTHSTMGSFREDLRKIFKDWRKEIDKKGLVIRPILYKKISGMSDFYLGYREMLVKNLSIDSISPDIKESIFYNNHSAYSNFQEVCKKNTSPGQAYSEECLEILEEPFKPIINNVFISVLKELDTQISEDNLSKRFFFAVRDKEIKGKQITQIMDFLVGIGLVISNNNSNTFKIKNKSYLDELRIKTESWLNNTANELIDEIKDIFPNQISSLKKSYKEKALRSLKKSEDILKNLNYSFLEEENILDINKEDLKNLIKDIYTFEKTLEEICPTEPSQKLDLKEFQIKIYQENFQKDSLSFWERLNFLREVKKFIINKKDLIFKEIDKQLEDSTKSKKIKNNDIYPFPISPLNQPLRSIQQEIESAFMEGKTLRDFVKLSEDDYKLSESLLKPDFEATYHRLKLLSDIVSTESSNSLWKKFISEHEKWDQIVSNFEETQKKWNELNKFIEDKPDDDKEEFNIIKKEFESIEDQVLGGLENDVNKYIENCPSIELINKLELEIKSFSSKPQDVSKKISNYKETLNQELRKIIDDTKLQALNHLLRAFKENEWTAPKALQSYKETKNLFENFNLKVSEEGNKYFESKNKVNWDLWLDIYSSLSKGKKVDWDNDLLNELEDMNLIERTVKLK